MELFIVVVVVVVVVVAVVFIAVFEGRLKQICYFLHQGRGVAGDNRVVASSVIDLAILKDLLRLGPRRELRHAVQAQAGGFAFLWHCNGSTWKGTPMLDNFWMKTGELESSTVTRWNSCISVNGEDRRRSLSSTVHLLAGSSVVTR